MSEVIAKIMAAREKWKAAKTRQVELDRKVVELQKQLDEARELQQTQVAVVVALRKNYLVVSEED